MALDRPRPLELWRLLSGARGSLRSALIEGSALGLGVSAYNSSLLLVQALLATHFLRDPREFGLVNAVMWAYSLAEVFTSSGLSLALTQHRGDAGPLIGPVWTVQVLRGALLGILVGAIGTAMSIYYGEPRIAPLAWTAALSAPLNGLAGLGSVLAVRELRFRRAAAISSLETTLGAAAGAILIPTLRSAWAVAIGLNALALARIVSSYALGPRSGFDFRWGKLRPFAGFAVSAFLASILAFLNERGDDLVVGTLLGLDRLGLYHVAFLYASLPGLKLGQVLGNVLIPVLARLRDDRPRFGLAVARFLRCVLALAVLIFAPLALAAPFLFGAIGHGRLRGAAPVFQVLCFFGALRFFHITAEAAFSAMGRPRLTLRANLVQLAVLAAAIVPLTASRGLVGTGTAMALGSAAAAVYSALALRRLSSPPRPERRSPPAPAVRESFGKEAACAS